ncbi:uncharacterized protein LOC118240055 [Electrophorus electricus]|uniref:uncharacterized protein LOC118240055 n=1 Tax=Electrophorus electricus TaxID=8005 RepID=UPI0015CFB637|nr:uncharacterized protein LOC118240055 [Electrophorus electricus]
MANVETLNEMAQLERSRFGRPPPRHGLKLLHWFANDCVTFDGNNNMVSQCDPEDEEYGFHYFENRYDRNGIKLLPDVNFPYYVVGNLNSEGSHELPGYVSEEYTGLKDDSNTDRIIVSLDDDWFDKVYITTHIDESNYDSDNTYRITKGLLKIISRLTLAEFLYKTGYQLSATMGTNPVAVDSNVVPANHPIPPRTQDYQIEIEDTPSAQSNNSTQRKSKGLWDFFSCTIL